jgi:transposase-like protein
VVIGVKADGTKELLACSDGYRESTESWADVLRGLHKRGMTAPAVAVGDGALGFWSALGDVFPGTVEQRCWVHKIANILAVLPKRLHRTAKAALHEIYEAETRADANDAVDEFVRQFGDKYPKAVAKLVKDRNVLLTFYDFPAQHWVHLRTTNPIESAFATVRARTRVTKGAGARRRGLVMAYKLLDAAQDRWRKVNSPELVIQVRAGIKFKDGIRVERRTQGSRDAA